MLVPACRHTNIRPIYIHSWFVEQIRAKCPCSICQLLTHLTWLTDEDSNVYTVQIDRCPVKTNCKSSKLFSCSRKYTVVIKYNVFYQHSCFSWVPALQQSPQWALETHSKSDFNNNNFTNLTSKRVHTSVKCTVCHALAHMEKLC